MHHQAAFDMSFARDTCVVAIVATVSSAVFVHPIRASGGHLLRSSHHVIRRPIKIRCRAGARFFSCCQYRSTFVASHLRGQRLAVSILSSDAFFFSGQFLSPQADLQHTLFIRKRDLFGQQCTRPRCRATCFSGTTPPQRLLFGLVFAVPTGPLSIATAHVPVADEDG